VTRNGTRMVKCIMVSLFFIGTRGSAQPSAPRLSCSVLASAKLASSEEAIEVMLSAQHCPATGPVALVRVWTQAPVDATTMVILARITSNLPDGRLIEPLFKIGATASESPLRRRAAIAVLSAFVRHDLAFGLTTSPNVPGGFAMEFASISHHTSDSVATPIAAADRRRIASRLLDLRQDRDVDYDIREMIGKRVSLNDVR
jgi:hypothetical protein